MFKSGSRNTPMREYIQYSQQSSVNDLDQNTVFVTPTQIANGITGRRMYEGPTIVTTGYLCAPNRDTTRQYILGIDRETHPNISSRFGFPNGLFYGHDTLTPGKYSESRQCSRDGPPLGVAPARFYECDRLSSNLTNAEVNWARSMHEPIPQTHNY